MLILAGRGAIFWTLLEVGLGSKNHSKMEEKTTFKRPPGRSHRKVIFVIFEVPGGRPRGSLTGNLQGSVALGGLSINVSVSPQT